MQFEFHSIQFNSDLLELYSNQIPEINWILNFKFNSNILNKIQIQLNSIPIHNWIKFQLKNEMQIGEEGTENLLISLVFEFFFFF
jgi:hypothetical protein